MSKLKTVAMIGFASGGLLLIAMVVVLLLLLGGGASIIGSWHNDDLNQVLRFHEDGTVVIHTGAEDLKAAYLFDESEGKGVIILNETTIRFTLSGGEMRITSGGAEHILSAQIWKSPPLPPIQYFQLEPPRQHPFQRPHHRKPRCLPGIQQKRRL